ncbi:MAG: S24/S26 family peptidase, partial [Deltaproteobacteria bacterium]|nr:S24/S26 family peptidase [Deltaproteobacteria bacterium]
GNSMYPVLRDNDFVVVKKTKPEFLRKGNILVYRGKNGQHIVHRLVKKERETVFYLKGDGYNLSPESTTRDSIVGKAIGFVRNNRYEPLNRGMELSSWFVSAIKEYAKHLLRRTFGISIIEGGKLS